jgi:septum formation protein
VVKDGGRIWHEVDSAELTVRPLSDSFIAAYLDAVGEAALDSVGAYQLEGLGAQLFTKVTGNYFTVLGLPLLPLLDFLREHEVIPQ